MNGIPSREQLTYLRQQYSPGTRVKLISMNDPYSELRPGDKGIVTYVDDSGTIFVDWDCGSWLGLILGEDQFKRI